MSLNNDLEKDLIITDWIKYKCTVNNVYAQNLYAALCNNIFIKNDVEWSCSWRGAGGIVASLIDYDDRHKNFHEYSRDYLDWYCSGIGAGSVEGYVSEGVVTSEISNDFLNLGWTYKRMTEAPEQDS